MELRRIFYGYRKDQFDYYIVQEEALVVNKIFRDYLAGHTLLEIAKELTAKQISYYKDKTQWTKNMVCRITENEHYCGDEEYPRIIDRETFDKAVKQKAEKGGTREKDTEEIAYLKATTICETCGKHFTRKSKYKVRERWLCSGGCSATTQYLDDPVLFSRIKMVMNAVRNCISNCRIVAQELTGWYGSSSTEVQRKKDESVCYTMCLMAAQKKYYELTKNGSWNSDYWTFYCPSDMKMCCNGNVASKNGYDYTLPDGTTLTPFKCGSTSQPLRTSCRRNSCSSWD